VEDHRVPVVGERTGEFVEEVENAPDADAVAVVAPRVIALRLRCRAAGRIGAEAGAEGEVLDIVAEIDGEPLAAGPRVVLAAIDWHVVVAVVGRQLHGARLQSGIRGGADCSIGRGSRGAVALQSFRWPQIGFEKRGPWPCEFGLHPMVLSKRSREKERYDCCDTVGAIAVMGL